MEIKAVTRDFADINRLFAINDEAFPDDERIPNSRFFDLHEQFGFTIWAFYENDIMVGFATMLHNPKYKMCYLWYFAIAHDCRRRNYGSQAMHLLQSVFPDAQIVLDMEQMTPGAQNYEQRVSRLRFYERNGFHRSMIAITYFGMHLELLFSQPPFRFDDFKALVGEYANTNFQPKFYKL